MHLLNFLISGEIHSSNFINNHAQHIDPDRDAINLDHLNPSQCICLTTGNIISHLHFHFNNY